MFGIDAPSSTRPPTANLVSFVVIAHNEAAGIERTLRSILDQRPPGQPREIVVVDDGSSDATPAIVAGLADGHEEIILVRLEENRGRGAARATGVRTATGRYLATVDADIVLPPDWLARCLDALDEHDAVAGIAVPDGDVNYLYRRFALTPKVVSSTTDITGNNALYRRDLFDAVNFDPSLREGEDVALSHALRARGARLMVLEDLLVQHEEHKSLRESLAWMYESGQGASRQFARYRQLRMPDLALLGWIVSLALAPRTTGRLGRGTAGLPLAYLLLAGYGHVSRSFVLSPRYPRRSALAVIADAVHIACYFTGRCRGLTHLADRF